MSNLTNEEMVKMMKPGLRVSRGRDWTCWRYEGVEDGNGPGTVLYEHPDKKNLWKVKWDNAVESSRNFYWMGRSETGENIYRLKIIEIPPLAPKKNPILGNKLFMAKDTFDLKIICEGKILECHKSVLCCRSEVFDVMFLNDEMIEAQSREVEINDIQTDTMETFLYFLYYTMIKFRILR